MVDKDACQRAGATVLIPLFSRCDACASEGGTTEGETLCEPVRGGSGGLHLFPAHASAFCEPTAKIDRWQINLVESGLICADPKIEKGSRL